MQKEKSSLFQIGVVVAVVGLLLQVLLHLSFLLAPLAHAAVVAGVVLVIIGLIVPRRRF